MIHADRGRHRAIALAATAALVLVACGDEGGEDDAATTEETAAPSDDASDVVLPAGVFGEACQDILVEAELPTTGAGTDTDTETDGGTDDGTDTDTATDGGTDDGMGTGTETDGVTDDGIGTDTETDGATDDGIGTDTETDGATGTDTDSTVGAGEEQPLRELSLIEAIEALPALSEFASALRTSTLGTELEQGTGQLTVFAPTDEAFGTGTSTTDDGTTDDGTTEEGGATDTGTAGATTTLDDHAIAFHISDEGALDAQALVDQETVSTLAGSDRTGAGTDDGATDGATDGSGTTEGGTDAAQLTVTAEGEVVTVEGGTTTATVVCANIETADGMLHIIDAVLEPQHAGTTGTETDGGTDGATDGATDGMTDGGTDSESTDGGTDTGTETGEDTTS